MQRDGIPDLIAAKTTYHRFPGSSIMYNHFDRTFISLPLRRSTLSNLDVFDHILLNKAKDSEIFAIGNG